MVGEIVHPTEEIIIDREADPDLHVEIVQGVHQIGVKEDPTNE